MLVPQYMINELCIGKTQQIGLALLAIVWWIYRTAPHITPDNCSKFMITNVGGLFLTLTAGVPVIQNPFFFQTLAFALIALAFVAKRVPEASEAIN